MQNKPNVYIFTNNAEELKALVELVNDQGEVISNSGRAVNILQPLRNAPVKPAIFITTVNEQVRFRNEDVHPTDVALKNNIPVIMITDDKEVNLIEGVKHIAVNDLNNISNEEKKSISLAITEAVKQATQQISEPQSPHAEVTTQARSPSIASLNTGTPDI